MTRMPPSSFLRRDAVASRRASSSSRRKPQAFVHALLLSCLSATAACTNTVQAPDGGAGGGFGSLDGFSDDGAGGFDAAGGSFGGGGFGGTGGGFGGCVPPDLFTLELQGDQVSPYAPHAQTLYAWISEDDEVALRAGGSPLPGEEERPFSVEQLAAWALGHPDSLEAAVMPLFEQSRSAWPHPWPVAFAPSGEPAGTRLLKIEVVSDAWVANVAEYGAIWEVFDAQGYKVDLEEVRKTPGRIALLHFVHLDEGANAQCGSAQQVVTGPAYREFVVGNPALITQYEIGTEAVLNELSKNITDLSEYMLRTRPCPTTVFGPFEVEVACSWGYTGEPFIDALASPSDVYRPTAKHLADLIEALEDTLFEPDPYVVQGPLQP